MTGRKRVWALAILLIIGLVVTAGCKGSSKAGVSQQKMKVVASVYPIYEFVSQVGGDRVEVSMLVPPGAEPHDWDPTAKDLAKIKGAKMFFYHGAGLEPVQKLLTKDVLGEAKPVQVSEGIALLQAASGEAEGHAGADVHTWLDPVYAQQEIQTIYAALAAMDPANQDYYKQNADRYAEELKRLDADYQAALATTPKREIITSHAAFGYLANRYHLQQVGIMGLSPESEPTPDRMAKVVEFCREHQVKYLFFETLVSPKLAQTIAQETGANLLVLNPIESLTPEDVKQGENYLTIMRENLANLQTALQ